MSGSGDLGERDAGESGTSGASDSGMDASTDANSGDAGGSRGILGATPPMGWNSWNTFGCNIDEALIKGVADTFVSSGMQTAGYEYVNIDDCWMTGAMRTGTFAGTRASSRRAFRRSPTTFMQRA
jgi:hypothetical protein